MKLQSDALLSAAELGDLIGADADTIKNWIRRGIIQRATIGGRNLRTRLFTTEEVYKTAFKNELVKLGIPPSSASDAVEELWKAWDRKADAEKRKLLRSPIPDWKSMDGGIVLARNFWRSVIQGWQIVALSVPRPRVCNDSDFGIDG